MQVLCRPEKSIRSHGAGVSFGQSVQGTRFSLYEGQPALLTEAYMMQEPAVISRSGRAKGPAVADIRVTLREEPGHEQGTRHFFHLRSLFVILKCSQITTLCVCVEILKAI